MSQYSPDRYQTELGGAREADDEDEEEDGMVHEEVDERSGKQFNLSKEDFQCIRYRDSQQGSVSDGELYCSRTYRDRKLSCEWSLVIKKKIFNYLKKKQSEMNLWNNLHFQ